MLWDLGQSLTWISRNPIEGFLGTAHHWWVSGMQEDADTRGRLEALVLSTDALFCYLLILPLFLWGLLN